MTEGVPGMSGQRLESLDISEIPDHEGLFDLCNDLYGLIPNSFLIMGRDPELLDVAGQQLHSTVMQKPGKTSIALRWMIGHISSRAAGSRYGSAHSGYFSDHLAGVTEKKLDAIWEFETSPLFDDAERAALRVAVGGGQAPTAVTDVDMAKLREHYDDDAIVEIIAVIGLFGFFNRWNDIFQTEMEGPTRDFADRKLDRLGPPEG